MADVRRFAFDFDPAYARAAAVFGVRPSSAWVELGDSELTARYGHWHVSTPLTNIASARVTGPYSFIKTAGPARLAVTDRGLTFASNGRRGVLIRFKKPVPGIDPAGVIRHPELTVTVAEVDRLVSALRERAQRAA
jgi:hypothetical protein